MHDPGDGHNDQDDNENQKKLSFDDIPTEIITPETRAEIDKIVLHNGSDVTTEGEDSLPTSTALEIGNAVDARIMQAETNVLRGEGINSGAPFGLLNFNEILSKPLQFKPVIDGWFCEGDNVLFHASGGTGKSLLTLFLAMFMASGQAFTEPGNSHPILFDQFPIRKPRNTLFIQSENTRTALYQRVHSMCEGDSRYTSGLDSIFIPEIDGDVCLTGMSFSDGGFTDWLKTVIDFIETTRGKRIDIVVIDPFISYFGGKNENDNGEMRNVLDQITKFARKNRVTPILVHHDGKDGLFRGASALHDWARSRIHLTLDKSRQGGPCVKITHEKNNNGPRFDPLFLRFDENLIFNVVNESVIVSGKTNTEISYENGIEIMKTLERMGGFEPRKKAIWNAYMDETGVTQTSARRAFDSAVRYGHIVEVFEETVIDGARVSRGFEVNKFAI